MVKKNNGVIILKKKTRFLFLGLAFILSISSVLFSPLQASAASYTVTPSLNAQNIYVNQSPSASKVKHSINVNKFGASGTDEINARYWVSTTNTKTESYGFKAAIDSARLQVKGVWTNTGGANSPDGMDYKGWGNNIFEWSVRKDINNTNYLAYGWRYRVTAPLDYKYYSFNGIKFHSHGGLMLYNYILPTNVDNIKINGFRVQPNPSALSASITDPTASSLSDDREIAPVEGAEDTNWMEDTEWTYVSVETIDKAKNGGNSFLNSENNPAKIANETKIQLTNGADNSVMATVTLEDFLRNTDKYEAQLNAEFNKVKNKQKENKQYLSKP